MTEECRHDCQQPPPFPQPIDERLNRPGLSHLHYRIGTYADFRTTLLRHLNLDPVLAPWTHRQPDDPGIALLEGAAILGDILTFYQELYANEAYLRTAQWRESIADLVRLLGYRLSPGLGGRAIFAFGVKGSEPVTIPAQFPLKAQVTGIEKPAEFETLTELVAEPALSQFSLYRPFKVPSIGLNTQVLTVPTADLEIQELKLEPGDRLMLVTHPASADTYRQLAVVAATQVHLDLTEITLEGSWQGASASTVTAYKLGQSYRYFGHNAPPTVTVVRGDQAVQDPVAFVREFVADKAVVSTAVKSSSSGAPSSAMQSKGSGGIGSFFEIGVGVGATLVQPLYVPPLTSDRALPLDQSAADLAPGSHLIVQLQLSDKTSGLGTTYFFERTIKAVTAAAATHGALTGSTTVVTLDQSLNLGSKRYSDIRTITCDQVIGEPLTLTAPRQADLTATPDRLYVYSTGHDYGKFQGRSLQLAAADRVETVITAIDDTALEPLDRSTLRPLSLSPSLQQFSLDEFPLAPPPLVTVYGNLVAATQGKREKETILGNGDSRQIFQTFKLPKAPLTYLNALGATPPEVPELEIYVGDRLWQRVPSFFGQDPKAEVYIVREDAGGTSWVQFGDNKTGARLPSGVNNVKAVYRTGTGAFGGLKPDTKVQAGDKLERLDKIWLPGVVSGGTEPESGSNARAAAPGKTQSLGRLVSLGDFETETLAIAGVAKATAAWKPLDNLPAVVLTVLMEQGRGQEITEVQRILNGYNRCRGPRRFAIRVEPGALCYLYLDVAVGIDPTFNQDSLRLAIQTVLGVNGNSAIDGSQGLLSLDNRQFGQREYAPRIEATIQGVAGVRWARVQALESLGSAVDPEDLPIPSTPQRKAIVNCGAQQILSLDGRHLQLALTAVTSDAEDCGHG